MDIALIGWFLVVGASCFLAGWYLRQTASPERTNRGRPE